MRENKLQEKRKKVYIRVIRGYKMEGNTKE